MRFTAIRIFGTSLALFGLFGGLYFDYAGTNFKVHPSSSLWTLAVFAGLFIQSSGEAGKLRSVHGDKNKYFSRNNIIVSAIIAVLLTGAFVWFAK